MTSPMISCNAIFQLFHIEPVKLKQCDDLKTQIDDCCSPGDHSCYQIDDCCSLEDNSDQGIEFQLRLL